MTRELKDLMNERRVPEQEIERFNKAQERLDFTTMFDVLYHTSCQYLKKRVGWMCGRSVSYDPDKPAYTRMSWTTEKINDAAIDMTTEILGRYKKDPSYRCLHMAAVHYAFLKIVYGKLQKEESRAKMECSFDEKYGYGEDSDYLVDREVYKDYYIL